MRATNSVLRVALSNVVAQPTRGGRKQLHGRPSRMSQQQADLRRQACDFLTDEPLRPASAEDPAFVQSSPILHHAFNGRAHSGGKPFHLPSAREPMLSPQDQRVAEASAEGQTESGAAKIVVVDDSPVDRLLVERLLSLAMPVQVIPAEDGAEALQLIRQHSPDVVLTDLNMPGMDGLELVQAVRRQHPTVPTILMTAYGSEEIAIAALRSGAANYVAKRRLSADLAETVQDVLSLAQHDRQQLELHECWMNTQFDFCLGNDMALVPALVTHLQQYSHSIGHFDKTELLRVGVALNEGLHNAIYHGNLELDSNLREQGSAAFYREAELRSEREPYVSRRVMLSACESRDESRYVIRDDGRGFDFARVLEQEAGDPGQLTQASRRGLFLIRTFMNEVLFNSAGNGITMIHRRQADASLPSSAARAAPHERPEASAR
jgi:CheY-like chemotaxis protein/anti-sigma regulatory factor (Ser/Thr protein kinase)